MLLWFASFIIYAIVAVTGYAIKNMADKIEVPVLNGKPTLDLAIAHIQTNYPAFWNVVFSDMADGLDGLLIASYFFVAVCLLQAFYSSLEMCCCPYRAKAEKPSTEATADATAPTAPGLLNPAAEGAKPDIEQPAEAAEAAKPEEAKPEEAKPDVEQPAAAAEAVAVAPAAGAAAEAAKPAAESEEVEM